MAHHHTGHALASNTVISPHLPTDHATSPTSQHPQHHLNRAEKPYSPHGSTESQNSSVYVSPGAFTRTEDEFASQVSSQTINGVRQTSPRFEVENSKKTYINLSTNPVEAKGISEQETSPYMYSSATTSTHLQEKYNGFTSSQAWRAHETMAGRESQASPSNIIACQSSQLPTISHASSNPRVGQRGEMGAFARLTDLLYDDLNRDEFDVYLKKET